MLKPRHIKALAMAKAKADETEQERAIARAKRALQGQAEIRALAADLSTPSQTPELLPEPAIDEEISVTLLDAPEVAEMVEAASAADVFETEAERTGVENMLKVALAAYKLLAEQGSASEVPPDDDFTDVFFGYVRNVSNERMQDLWARLLAGKFRNPERYSLRTLDILRNLSQRDAEIFVKCCKVFNDEGCLILPNPGRSRFDKFIEETELRRMREHELLYMPAAFDSSSSAEVVSRQPGHATRFKFRSKIVHITAPPQAQVAAPQDGIRIAAVTYKWTAWGYQLQTLVKPEPDDDYLAAFCAALERQGLVAKVVSVAEDEAAHVDAALCDEIVKRAGAV
jgi:hypothetical protein